MLVILRAAWAVGVLCIGVTAFGQGNAALLVISKRDQTLAMVDPVTLQVVAKMPVGNDPHEVIASADGTTAYVSNYGSGAYNTLAVLDLVGHKALAPIDLGALHGPHGLAFAGGKVWFTVEGSKAIGRYDPAAHQVDWVMGTGQNRTHMIHVSEDGMHIVATNVSSSTVSIIEFEPTRQGLPPGGRAPGGRAPRGSSPAARPPGTGPAADTTPPPTPPLPPRPALVAAPPAASGAAARAGGQPTSTLPLPRVDWNQTIVPVGRGSEGFDVSPDGKEIWVANGNDATLSVIDYAAKKAIATLAVNVRNANRLKFTPDGKRVLVSSAADLVVVDAATREVVKRIQLGQFGHGAGGILVQPDGVRAYVGLGPDNFVVVVDLRTLEVAGHLDVGGEPDGMAWAERR